jgi:hypothetical protein
MATGHPDQAVEYASPFGSCISKSVRKVEVLKCRNMAAETASSQLSRAQPCLIDRNTEYQAAIGSRTERRPNGRAGVTVSTFRLFQGQEWRKHCCGLPGVWNAECKYECRRTDLLFSTTRNHQYLFHQASPQRVSSGQNREDPVHRRDSPKSGEETESTEHCVSTVAKSLLET